MTDVRLESINLNLMLALHWLVAERSVTRAAHRMGVSQPAMSRSLAQLRELLDDPLLVPMGGALQPTACARSLEGRLAHAVAELRGILRGDAAFHPSQTGGVMEMLATEHAMGAVVDRYVAALRAEAPGLEVRVSPAHLDAFSAVAGGRAELLIGPKIGPTPANTVTDDLLAERFVCVMRRANPAAKRALTLARFCALEHVVVYPLGGDRASLVDRALAERGRERRVVVRVPFFSSALSIVAHSDAVVTLPASLAPARLAIREPPLELPGFVLQAVWSRRLEESPRQRWARALLREVAST